MAVNKVIYSGETLIDTSGVTVTAETLAEGETALNAAGEEITGTFTLDNEITEQDSLIEQIKNALQDKVSGGFPKPTADDEGKFLSVVGGVATWVALPVAEDIVITIAEEITFNE